MNIDFSFWLLVLTIASGIIAIIDKFKFEPKRLAPVIDQLKGMSKKERHKFIQKNKALKAPFLADYARSLFSVFLIVFILRGFLIGNFLIPSASMTPTLPVGNFILVNKTAYGIRNPITNAIWIKTGDPQRGDIVVFHFPVNPNVDFIKRVVGVPGDVISYQNKKLTINGKSIEYSNCKYDQINSYNGNGANTICMEHLGNTPHEIDMIANTPSADFTNLVVPQGMYFVMGDNRDNSEDSRYWGFVSEKDLVGKARFVWFSWNSLNNSIRWNQIARVL
ncbi:signal peptidase I [Fastidiosibacter lacustris]|uniref:signal peptidase I n=1 Tax=Fastidiosibacter lacustris TaxID=2056695 RepID=UPI000E3517DC|nr:signal peptidase I [Fastidiosibacter lacustris]